MQFLAKESLEEAFEGWLRYYGLSGLTACLHYRVAGHPNSKRIDQDVSSLRPLLDKR